MNSLELIGEAKIHRLLPDCDDDNRLEASGIVAWNGHFVVIFDNLCQAAVIAASLSPGSENRWIGRDDKTTGFEDVTYEPRQQRFYVLIEAMPGPGDTFRAEVVEYDDGFNRRRKHKLPFDFESENKGFEGLACVRRDDHDYLLALCEGNLCQSGDEGRQPGGGRIQVFRRGSEDWTHVGTLNVPPAAQFVDYASIDVRDGQVAVLSQASSQLWLGALQPSAWDFVDEGVVYRLPKDEEEKPVYCNAEGVALLAPNRVAIASDRKKKDAPKRCEAKDESIHIFQIPESTGGRVAPD